MSTTRIALRITQAAVIGALLTTVFGIGIVGFGLCILYGGCTGILLCIETS